MKWSSIGARVAGLAVGFLLVGMLAGDASAQYPPPTGSASMTVSDVAPATGSTVSISTTVLNQFGTPAFGLACTFQVLSQPGTDAMVDAGPKVTDTWGVATTTLNVGSTPGTIIVGANCGEMSSQVSVVAGGAPAAITLPPTGTGPEAAPPSFVLIAALLTAGLLCVAGSVSIRMATRPYGPSGRERS